MANDTVLKTANRIHKTLLKLSGGRVGWQTGKMPVLRLTTTGRKSGKQRTVMLTTPHQHGDAVVVVASKAGDDRHPEWFLNLRANPEVTVDMKSGPERTMTARIATDEEHDLLWPIITEKYKNYAGYQDKTDRKIPLVLLDPRI